MEDGQWGFGEIGKGIFFFLGLFCSLRKDFYDNLLFLFSIFGKGVVGSWIGEREKETLVLRLGTKIFNRLYSILGVLIYSFDPVCF